MKRTMKAVILAVIAAAGSISLSSCGKPLTPIDPFEKLEVTFNGISGYTGSVDTNDPELRAQNISTIIVRRVVMFSPMAIQ